MFTPARRAFEQLLYVAAIVCVGLAGASSLAQTQGADTANGPDPDAWTAMLDFFDKHVRGKPTDRTFDRFPTEQELDAAFAAAKASQ